MNKTNYLIRKETEADFFEVENLTREAFWNVYKPGCEEHFVLLCYRKNPDFIPELSLVLELDKKIIGHVMYVNASEIFPEFAGFRFPLLDKKIY